MKKTPAIYLLAIGVLMVSVPLFAHHGGAAYDPSKTVIVKGTVTDYIWANLHCWVKIDGKGELAEARALSKTELQQLAKLPSKGDGNMQHWVIEGGNPPDMARQGYNRNTIKPGDVVTVLIMPPKNGTPTGRIS
jgi:Family of unknown function (DUF6152)